MYLGIDNGLSGGIAVIDDDNKIVLAEPMPTIKVKDKRLIDIKKLSELITKHEVDFAVIENAHAMPGQGVSSMFSFGRVFGINLALLEAHGIPYKIVESRTWQKEVFKDLPADDTKLALQGATKIRSINFVHNNYGLDTKNHGITDAICMAFYARELKRPTI
jgi:crossover junction endodeoxyribonuclease RuvC